MEVVAYSLQVVPDFVIALRRHFVSIGPQDGRAAEIEVPAVRGPGGIGFESVLFGKFWRGLYGRRVGEIVSKERIEVYDFADFASGGVKELAYFIVRICYKPAAGVPGGVGEFCAELSGLAIFYEQGAAAVLGAAEADGHFVGTVVAERMTVKAHTLVKPVVQYE